MNQEIEALLVHWGEQKRRNGACGALPCVLAMAVEFQGPAPRGVPGSRLLLSGAGMDAAAEHIEAVIMDLRRQGAGRQEAAERAGRSCRAVESELARLASARYLTDPRPAVAEQIKMAGISSRRTYDLRLGELHDRVIEGLRVRLLRRVA